MTTDLPRVGIFGAGKAGSVIARLALGAGYPVRIATRSRVDHLKPLLDIIAPGAVASDSNALAEGSDIIVLAVPLRRYRELPLHRLGGKVVVDAMNYWPALDGSLPEFEVDPRPSTAIIRDALPPDARLVKTFSHLGYHQLEDLPGPPGTPDRAALAIASDDAPRSRCRPTGHTLRSLKLRLSVCKKSWGGGHGMVW